MRNRIIDSRQIAAFSALVRHRSFTMAAKDLFLTQSAVSHAIKSLEEEIGCRLFERTGRSMTLTRAGEQFHQRTERILSEMRAARVELEQLSADTESQLCVGVGPLVCQHVLPRVLQEFKESHPHCSVRLEPGSRASRLELLRTHQIDFAITVEGPRPDLFSFEELFDDELLFFVSARHPWVRLSRVPRAAIAEATFIIYDKTKQTSQILEEYFRAEKITPKNLIDAESSDAAKELVKAGVGVGLFAPWQVAAESDQGSLTAVRLAPKKLTRKWVVARLKGRQPTSLEQEFIRRCKLVLQTLGAAASCWFLIPI
jgi:DNA-binding transcriptional LysR family regulator